MSRVDVLGDRFCIAVSWIGFFYIMYWHVIG